MVNTLRIINDIFDCNHLYRFVLKTCYILKNNQFIWPHYDYQLSKAYQFYTITNSVEILLLNSGPKGQNAQLW